MKGIDFLRWYVPLILWAATILTLTSIPTLKAPDLGFGAQDKLGHLGVYYIFGLLLFRAVGKGLILPCRSVIFSILFALFFAALDELHQLFIPGRSSDVFDFFADSIGIFLAQLSFLIFSKFANKKANMGRA